MDDDIVIIVLSNSSLSPVTRMTFDIISILEGLQYTIPEQRTAKELDPDKLDAFVGEYEFIEVTKQGDALFMSFGDSPAFQIFPETSTRFFSKIADIDIKFTKTDLAGVIGVVVSRDGVLFGHPWEYNLRKTPTNR